MQQIATASTEQGTSAKQITTVVFELEGVIRSNAAAAEELASTSEELSAQAAQLLQFIGFFHVHEDRPLGKHPRTKAAGNPREAQEARRTRASLRRIDPAPHREVTDSSPKGFSLDLADGGNHEA